MSQATDRIFITGLKACCLIGVDQHERCRKQDVVINLALTADLRLPCRSDRLKDTVDYRALVRTVRENVAASRYHLLEALAESIARVCLLHRRVREVTVQVSKPKVLPDVKDISIEITRGRSSSPSQTQKAQRRAQR